MHAFWVALGDALRAIFLWVVVPLLHKVLINGHAILSADRLVSLAWSEIDRGFFTSAILLAGTARRVDPHNEGAYLALGYAYIRQRKPDAARSVLEHGERLNPKNPLFAAYRGELELGLGRHAQAEQAYRVALDLRADDPKLVLNLAHALLGQGRSAEAELLLEEALSLAPDNVRVLATLSQVRADQGNAAAAESLLRRAVSIDPDFAELHYALSLFLARSGRSDEAIKEARRAADLRPGEKKYLVLEHRIKRGPVFEDNDS